MKFKKPLLKRIAFHAGLMIVLGNCVLFLFFQFLLPALTHHGQFITVPNLRGIALEEVDACLSQRNLCFEVSKKFAYAPDDPPMVVLQQYPKAGARVKEGRKIYLTLNMQTPPKVKMPKLVDGSLRNAQVRLESRGLLLGSIKYVPDLAQDAVLEQWYQGKKIPEGASIALGAKIDLVVGAGLGNQLVEIPQVIGMRLEDAKPLLLRLGIQIGNVAYERHAEQPTGTILRQRPDAGQAVHLGEHIDLWLVADQEKGIVMPDKPVLP